MVSCISGNDRWPSPLRSFRNILMASRSAWRITASEFKRYIAKVSAAAHSSPPCHGSETVTTSGFPNHLVAQEADVRLNLHIHRGRRSAAGRAATLPGRGCDLNHPKRRVATPDRPTIPG